MIDDGYEQGTRCRFAPPRCRGNGYTRRRPLARESARVKNGFVFSLPGVDDGDSDVPL